MGKGTMSFSFHCPKEAMALGETAVTGIEASRWIGREFFPEAGKERREDGRTLAIERLVTDCGRAACPAWRGCGLGAEAADG